MKKNRIIFVITACMAVTAFAGCGSENKKNYDQAVQDLSQGNYDYALKEFTTAVSAGYKLA